MAPVGCFEPTGVAQPKEVVISAESVKNSLYPNKRQQMHDQLYVHFVTFSVFRRRTLLNHEHAKLILLRWLNEVLDRWQALWQDCVCRVPLDGTSGIDPWDCRSIGFSDSTSFGCATPVGSKQPTGATLCV